MNEDMYYKIKTNIATQIKENKNIINTYTAQLENESSSKQSEKDNGERQRKAEKQRQITEAKQEAEEKAKYYNRSDDLHDMTLNVQY